MQLSRTPASSTRLSAEQRHGTLACCAPLLAPSPLLLLSCRAPSCPTASLSLLSNFLSTWLAPFTPSHCAVPFQSPAFLLIVLALAQICEDAASFEARRAASLALARPLSKSHLRYLHITCFSCLESCFHIDCSPPRPQCLTRPASRTMLSEYAHCLARQLRKPMTSCNARQSYNA